VLSFGIALIYARGGAGNQPVVGADRRIERRFYPTQALVISDGKPYKSPAVNTVASTFWFYVASTIFMALCVTQDVLTLPQLRKVSTVLVLGHVMVFLLAMFRHSDEAPIRDLCRKIKSGHVEDRIDKTEFEKLYAAGGKESLEAAVFETIDCYFKQEFKASDGSEDPWERFRSQFCALETFWKEPVSAEMLPLKDRKPADGQPTRWNWLKHKAKKKADDLEDKIKRKKHFTKLREALKEVKEKDEKPYQQLLQRGETGGAVTEAVLQATEACIDERTLKKDADALTKSKLMVDETVLPPLLRAFAFNCFPLLDEKLGEIKKEVEEQSGTEIIKICDEEKSVKATKRMVAKMVKEIAKDIASDEGRAFDKNRKWQPVSASVRDVLRATFVCENPKAMIRVYNALNDKAPVLELRKLKNKVFPAAAALAQKESDEADRKLAELKAAKADEKSIAEAEKTAAEKVEKVVMRAKIPFNLHAVYEFWPVAERRAASILVEIQIHDAKIRKQSGAQHKFYEISRAGGSKDLLKVAAGGDFDAKDLMKQEHMKKIAERSSRFRWSSSGRWVLESVRSLRRGQKSRRMSGQE
jgi:hypothetical protein